MLEAHLGLDVGRGNLGRGQDLLGKCPEVREARRRPPPVQAGAELPLVLFSSASPTSLAAFDQGSTRFSLHPGYGPDSSTATENRLDKNLAPTNIVSTLGQGEARGQSRIEREIKKRNPFDSAEQEAALNLGRTYDRLQSSFTQFFKQHGITGAQYNVLRICAGQGSRCLARKLLAG